MKKYGANAAVGGMRFGVRQAIRDKNICDAEPQITKKAAFPVAPLFDVMHYPRSGYKNFL